MTDTARRWIALHGEELLNHSRCRSIRPVIEHIFASVCHPRPTVAVDNWIYKPRWRCQDDVVRLLFIEFPPPLLQSAPAQCSMSMSSIDVR